MYRAVSRKTYWLPEVVLASGPSMFIVANSNRHVGESILVSFGDCSVCFVHHMTGSTIRWNKLFWSYQDNRSFHVMCHINILHSSDRLGWDNANDTESKNKVQHVRLLRHHPRFIVQWWFHHGPTKRESPAYWPMMLFGYTLQSSLGW